MPLQSPQLTQFTTSSAQLVNFDWTDFASGVGYTSFYGVGMEDDSGSIYKLSANVLLDKYQQGSNASTAQKDNHRVSTAAGTTTELIDVTFNTDAFNIARTVKGDVFVAIPFSAYSPSGATSWHCTVSVDFLQNSTVIATNGSEERSTTGSGVTGGDYFLFPIAVPLTDFKVGDTMGITIRFNGWKESDANTVGFMMAYNSQNTAITATDAAGDAQERQALTNTQMRIDVPFRIDE